MADPRDQGFELNGVLFGNESDEPVIVEDFQPGGFTWRTQDQDHPSEDGRRMGRDYLTPSTWTFSLGVNRASEAEALSTLTSLAHAWDSDLRATSGLVDALRYRVNKRTRRVYGRGRNFTPTLDVRRMFGYIGVEATFDRVDSLHYDDVESGVSLGLSASAGTGFTTPVITPLTTINPSTSREGSITVDGDVPAWPVITIYGPTTKPAVTLLGGWVLALDGTLEAGEYVTIDTRPWVRSVLRNGSVSAANMISRSIRLPEITLPPGQRVLSYKGIDPTGTSRATVNWRPAYKSL